MRNVTLDMKVRIPSWNYCTLDDFTGNGRFSKETCRFCVKAKGGHRCVLYDEALAIDGDFVCKTRRCIKVSAGYPDEPSQPVPVIDPRLIMQETLKEYKKAVQYLRGQGFPQGMAETLAEKSVLGGK